MKQGEGPVVAEVAEQTVEEELISIHKRMVTGKLPEAAVSREMVWTEIGWS